MKRTTTLLALVALVLASVALHSLQAPIRSARGQGSNFDEVPTVNNSCACNVDRTAKPALRTALIPPEFEQPPECIEMSPSTLKATETENGQLKVADSNWPSEGPTVGLDCKDAECDEPPPGSLPSSTDSGLDVLRKTGNPTFNWLRDHQCEDGRWSAADFGAASTRKDAHHTYNVEFFAPGLEWGDKGQSPDNDLVVTALALLCHFGSGYDHKDGYYKSAVRKALIWLRKQQHESGRFGDVHDNAFLPTHALCTAALADCYSLSGDSALKQNCEIALAHLLTLQTQGSGFARYPSGYGLEAEPDVATTAWSVLALKTAKFAGVEFDLQTPGAGLLEFLDSVTSVVHGPGNELARVYTRLRERGGDCPDGRAAEFSALNTLDAMNAYCRAMLSQGEDDWKLIRALAQNAVAHPPAWESNKIDFVHWFFSTAAAFQALGSRPPSKTDNGWAVWEKPLAKALLDNQRGYRTDERKTWPAILDEFGSWDAVDAYSRQGGRVYTTAMAALCLQIYYRYRRQTKD